jgi:hypothetical protein
MACEHHRRSAAQVAKTFRIAGARRLSFSSQFSFRTSLLQPANFRVAARNELACIGRVAQFLHFGGFLTNRYAVSRRS